MAIEAVPDSKPLGAIRDGENALVIHTHYYQPIPMVLRGYGAGAAVTAAGVFGDLLRTVWRPLDNCRMEQANRRAHEHGSGPAVVPDGIRTGIDR